MDRKAGSLTIIMIMVMIVMSCVAKRDISCGEVLSAVKPCVPYIVGGGSPARDCCRGIENLYEDASTTGDKQTVCQCLKSVVSQGGGDFNTSALEGLPDKCGVDIPYKISPSTDCSSVQ